MFEVRIRGAFVAAHQLLLADGPEPLHSHEWHVEVTYAGARLAPDGMLVDFLLLREHLDRAAGALHNTNLNELPAFAGRNPSAEHVAAFLAERMPARLPGDVRLRAVDVEEEAGCFARYLPPT
jgi:6-pyruvoyltetrahydropterin/6-carboxytetrahydropterin synthase